MSLAEFVYTVLLKPRPLRVMTNALLLRFIPRVVTVGPATIHLDQEDPVLSAAVALRVYERAELRFFREHCRGDATFRGRGRERRPLHRARHARAERTVAANRREGRPRVEAFSLAAADRLIRSPDPPAGS